ncbi:MAG TPA: outer membrane protein assembly factor BamA [Ignavibacteriaceae bacterium]|nr:outer membrane protein assembly factor BamA [Ignavibacteriaceae bacterium]
MLFKFLYKYIFVTSAVILFGNVTLAQIATTSYKVIGISVEGNKSADSRTITINSGLKIGDEIQVPGDQTANAIKQLWSLNIFSDVQIVIEKQIADGVYLLIKVEEYPRIERAVVEGNDDVSESDLQSQINLTRGQILKPQEVERIRLKILKKYEEEGFFNAEVTPKYFTYFSADTTDDYINVIWQNRSDLAEEYTLEYNKSDITYSNLIDRIKDRMLLKYEIKEGDKVTVRKIEFLGNVAFTDGDLKGEMEEIEEAKWWKFWSMARFDKTKYEADKEFIEAFYKKNGYRDAEIISDSLVYENNKKDLNIFINVHEGSQFKVRNITWTGNTIYTEEMLNERLGFSKGDIYDLEAFNRNLRGNEKQTDIAALYLDNGYLTFNLNAIETKIGEDSIDILIQISEKSQFKVGKVDILGNDRTKDKVIRRELYTIPGDYFNRTALFRSLQQLANLQYFNVEKLYSTGVDYQLVNDSTVDVSYRVEEKSSDYLNASVGYSGAYGFSGAVGVTLTNFSITEPFSLGGGQILSFNWQFGVGNYYRTFSLGFTEPWFLDTPTLIGFEFFDTRQQYIYDLSQSGATVKLGRRLKWPDDYFYIQGIFRYQYNNIKDGGYYYASLEGRKFQQYTLGASISRRNIDNPTFPSQGSSVGLDGEISGGPFLPGDVDYFKILFKSEWYKKLFNFSRLVLYTSADVGYLEELTAGTPIQPFDYFYMGGNGLVIATTPLRGYDDRTVGPVNVYDEVFGGKFSVKFTAELRLAVSLEPIPLYLLTFAEAGNVFESFEKADFFNLRRAVGVGARILINPVGLIGFDLGYGFDRRAVDGKDPAWLFHFQFGRGF